MKKYEEQFIKKLYTEKQFTFLVYNKRYNIVLINNNTIEIENKTYKIYDLDDLIKKVKLSIIEDYTYLKIEAMIKRIKNVD